MHGALPPYVENYEIIWKSMFKSMPENEVIRQNFVKNGRPFGKCSSYDYHNWEAAGRVKIVGGGGILYPL